MRASISWPVPLPVRFTISPPAEIGCHARPELQTVLVVDFSAIAQDASMIWQPVSGQWTPSDSSMRGRQCRVEQVTSCGPQKLNPTGTAILTPKSLAVGIHDEGRPV